MLRKLAAIGVFAGSSLVTSMSSAVGLGEIKLYSSLNQPLNAEIKLYQVSRSDLASLQVNLASMQDFQRADIDRPYFLTGLDFEVVESTGSTAVVRVTSQQAVREPFLNFLVSLNWRDGKVLKEYTLLMDLATLAPARAAAVQAQPQPRPQAQSRTSNASSGDTSSATRERQWQTADGEYRVRANDTLWEIALNVRPSSSLSPHQVMKALFDLNPNAFIGNNMNRVKQGAVLRLPTESEINQISRGVAVAELQSHNSAADSGSPVLLDGTSAAPDYGQTVESDRLVLSAAQDNGNAASQGSAQSGSSVSVAELDAAKDEVARQERENDELRQRIAALEAQVETANQLLELRSDEMAAVQTVAAQAQQSPVDTDAIDSEAEQLATPEAIVDEPAAGDTSAVAEVAEAEVASTPQPSANSVTIPENKSVVDQVVAWIANNLMIVGGALVALLLGGLLVNRRKKDDDASDDVQLVQPEVVELAVDEDLDQDSTKLEEDLAGVDLKIAYGEYDEAEQTLHAIASDYPASSAVSLKYCELYVEVDNRQRFDEQLAALRASGDVAAVEQAEAMLVRFEADSELPDLDALGLGDDLNDDINEDLGDDLLDLDLDVDSQSELTDVEGLADVEELAEVEEVEEVVAEELSVDADLTDEEDFDIDSLDLDGLTFVSRDDEVVNETNASDEAVDEQVDPITLEDAATDSSVNADVASDLDLDLDLDLDETLTSMEDLDESLDGAIELDDAIELDGLDLPLDGEELSLDDVNLEIEESDPDDTLGEIEIELEDESALEVGDSLELDGDASAEDVFDGLEEVSFDLESLDEDLDAMGALDEPVASEEQVVPEDATSAVEDALDDIDDIKFDELEEGDDLSEPLDTLDDIDLDYDLDEIEVEAAPADGGLDDVELAIDLNEEVEVEAEVDAANAEMTAETVAADLVDADDLEDFDFLADADEIATKLDLARAYIDMGDRDGAREILDEVISEGNDEQQNDAKELVERL